MFGGIDINRENVFRAHVPRGNTYHCNNGVPHPCRFDNSSMSSSEEISLQPQSREKVEDGSHTSCTAPLEQEDSRQGATIRAVAPVTMVRWRKLFTAVMHLLAYTLLNAGIAMIEPFYPIVVSFTYSPYSYSYDTWSSIICGYSAA